MPMSIVRKKLLIIDDEEELREVLASLLETKDLEISVACNGVEGIEMLGREKFDAVLSDEKMPKKSGLDVLKWMHENDMRTPFIIHSGYGEASLMEEAKRLGAYAFIDKPWNERTLIDTVYNALQKKS